MTTRAALVSIIFGTGLACTTPAMAQTYDPNYPVCLQYARDGYIDCSFTSMPQCNATASGRGRHATPTHISHRASGRRGGTEFAN
jgi:hypothetical protein